jgi:hypothetical protein
MGGPGWSQVFQKYVHVILDTRKHIGTLLEHTQAVWSTLGTLGHFGTLWDTLGHFGTLTLSTGGPGWSQVPQKYVHVISDTREHITAFPDHTGALWDTSGTLWALGEVLGLFGEVDTYMGHQDRNIFCGDTILPGVTAGSGPFAYSSWSRASAGFCAGYVDDGHRRGR